MSLTCPNCGHHLEAPAKHRSELERQLGSDAKAAYLRTHASALKRDPATRLDGEFIAWRGYVWSRCQTRKTATCAVTGVTISAGASAWRQLSEVRDRALRVSAYAWANL